MRDTDYFASDVHLAAARSDVSDRFLRFLDTVREDGRRLFLLGDIFDVWVGPKQTRLPYVVPVLARIRELTAAGVEVHYLAGNRDFNFDARVNGGPPPRRLPESLSVESGGRRLFLTHGDLFCTRDRGFRRARWIGRLTPIRMAFSHMPLALSGFLSEGYSRLSIRSVKNKARWTMAVDFSRVKQRLIEGHDMVVCGHVHRGARYRVDLPGGREGEFVTLGDWRREGVYLVSRPGELSLRKFP